MEIIKINQLKKYFSGVKAVDGIDISVEEGEIFGYLGPNGAGKSTTIACMMGFINPTAGKISIFGKDISKNRTAIKKDIGYLPSDVQLYGNLTGTQHIKLIEGIRGKSKILQQLLWDFSFDPKRKVKQLSTGNKQKLAIILAFMNQPKLLLLDEPTNGLDPLLQDMFYKYLLKFKKNGTTIFMSSHNLSEIEKLADRVAIIKKGKILAVETIATLKKLRTFTIKAYFTEPTKISQFKVDSLEAIKQLDERSIQFNFRGDINPIMRELNKHKLHDLEIIHASLEEIFMEYYK